MTAFLDAAVFMYAGGAEHPLRGPCQAILRRAKDGTLEATTSAEVVQEILHRFISIRRPAFGISIARDALAVFNPVLPVTDAVIRRVPELVGRYPLFSARDLVHVATCIEEGIDSIVSPDRGFDTVKEIKRIDPFRAAT